MDWFSIEEVVKFILILLSLWGFWYLSGKNFILNKLEKFIPFDNDVENNKSGSKRHAHINYLKYVFRLIFVGLVSAFIIPILTGTWFHNWPISIGADAGLRTAILTATGGVVVLLTFIETHRKNIDDAFRDRKLKGLELLGSENSRSRLIGFDMLSVLIDEKINEDDKQEAQQILNHICNNISVSSMENKDENISRTNNIMVESIRRHYHVEDRYAKASWSDLSIEFFGCDFKINTTFERMEVKHKFIFRNCRFDIMRFRGSKINELHFIDCEFGYFMSSESQEIVLDLSLVNIENILEITRCKNKYGLPAKADQISIDIKKYNSFEEWKGAQKDDSASSLRGILRNSELFNKEFYDCIYKAIIDNWSKSKDSDSASLAENNGIGNHGSSTELVLSDDKNIDSSDKPASKGPVQVPHRDSKKSLPQNVPQRENRKRVFRPVEPQQSRSNAQSPENANHGGFGLFLESTSNKKNGEVGQSNSSRQPAPRARPVPRQR